MNINRYGQMMRQANAIVVEKKERQIKSRIRDIRQKLHSIYLWNSFVIILTVPILSTGTVEPAGNS